MVENITTIYENLPHGVSAFTMHNAADDWYTIVLNSRQSYNTLQKSFKHELAHIQNKDFTPDKDVEKIECYTH